MPCTPALLLVVFAQAAEVPAFPSSGQSVPASQPADAGFPAATSSSAPPGPPAPPLPPLPPELVRHARVVDGVSVQVLVMANDAIPEPARNAAEEALAEYARVVRLVSAPDGAVAALQREAGVKPVPVPPEVLEVLQAALRACTLSGGAYDPTAAAYAPLWPFGTTLPQQSPPPEELARRTPLVDCRRLVLDAPARTAFLQQPGMKLDLEDAARALAMEKAVGVLQAAGYGDVILYAAGDVVVSGHKAGRRWSVGIQDPRGSSHFAALPVSGGGVFTTGDYEQSFMERGRRMHAVLDPRTGLPARGARSVTVVARNAVDAALLSRAVFVMGPDAGMKLAERLAATDVVLVDDRNRVMATRGVAGQLKYRPPTDGP